MTLFMRIDGSKKTKIHFKKWKIENGTDFFFKKKKKEKEKKMR